MAKLVLSVFISLLASLYAGGRGFASDAIYMGGSLDRPSLMEREFLELFTRDGQLHVGYGDVAFPAAECVSGWDCLPVSEVDFALPSDCTLVEKSNSWTYRDSVVTFVGRTAANKPRDEAVYSFEVAGGEGRPSGIVYVGSSRGVVSFSYLRGDTFYYFFLTSPKGVSVGTCLENLD